MSTFACGGAVAKVIAMVAVADHLGPRPCLAITNGLLAPSGSGPPGGLLEAWQRGFIAYYVESGPSERQRLFGGFREAPQRVRAHPSSTPDDHSDSVARAIGLARGRPGTRSAPDLGALFSVQRKAPPCG